MVHVVPDGLSTQSTLVPVDVTVPVLVIVSGLSEGLSIGVIKRVFGFAKVRYRGLDKNAHRLFVTAALANLFILRGRFRCA